MFSYEKIDVSEGIDVNKTNESCRCIIYNNNYFLKYVLDFSRNYTMVVTI